MSLEVLQIKMWNIILEIVECKLVQNLLCYSVICLYVGWYNLQQLQQPLESKIYFNEDMLQVSTGPSAR